MNSLHFYARSIIRHALLVSLAVPALGWAHGAVDIPITRQTLCRSYADYWGAPDKMKDEGCRRAVTEPGYSGQLTHAGTQWHEVTLNIAGRYNDADGGEAAVKALVPDGKLCSVNRSGMDVLNLAMPQWTKTEVTPDANGKMKVRLIATAPHVPSFVRIYLSKPGYDSTSRPLKWDDLELIHSEELTESRKDWGDTPPAISGTSAFFQFDVQMPPNRSGNAVLFTRWQRRDPVGEGFYGCSDITFTGQTQPPAWVKEKVFIDGNGVDPKPGDTVHYRVFGHDRAVTELVDLKLSIDASNQTPALWGKQLADRLASHQNIIRVGVKKNGSITFNPTEIYANYNYLSDARNSTQMSVDTGDDGGNPPTPVDGRPPVAMIDGRAEIKAGERFIMDGKRSTSYNSTPLRYVWVFEGGPGWTYGSNTEQTFTITTPASDKISTAKLLLNVYDDSNKKHHQTQVMLTARPESGGGDYPAYQTGRVYEPGEIVTNKGSNYKCRPYPKSGWCGQSPSHYKPGEGSDWRDAWEQY